MSASTVLAILFAVALLALVAALLRSGSFHPWRAIGLAALTSAVCVTVGGDSAADVSGPSTATVVGAVAGFLSVVAAILALVPRDPEKGGPSRMPLLLACGGTVVGAVGLVLNQLMA